MKYALARWMTAVTIVSVLAIPTHLAAAHTRPHYLAIDIGTFGGPNAFPTPPYRECRGHDHRPGRYVHCRSLRSQLRHAGLSGFSGVLMVRSSISVRCLVGLRAVRFR